MSLKRSEVEDHLQRSSDLESRQSQLGTPIGREQGNKVVTLEGNEAYGYRTWR